MNEGHIDIISMNWLLGIIIPAGIAWSTAVIWLLRDIKRQSDNLILMHKSADEHGFGTVDLGKELRDHIMEENLVFANMTKALHDLVHYVRWAAKQQAGQEPPPPTPFITNIQE